MNSNSNINWYPGHMVKAKRQIAEQAKLVDVIIELADARIPSASFSDSRKEIPTLSGRPLIVALSKSALADEKASADWLKRFQQNDPAVLIDCITGEGLPKLQRAITEAHSAKQNLDISKGKRPRGIRLMVIGIPNVGKSTLINALAGRKGAKTADRPGVTRVQQWIRVKGGYELLDTPGVLLPRYEDSQAMLKLAITGAIRDEVVDNIDVAANACGFLCNRYPELLISRYKLDPDVVSLPQYDVLSAIAKSRGFIVKGGELDLTRTAAVFLDELRAGKVGRITFEQPE